MSSPNPTQTSFSRLDFWPWPPRSSTSTRRSSPSRSTLAFGRPFYKGGLVNRRAVLKSSLRAVRVPPRRRTRTDGQMRDYLKALCAGWQVQQVHDIVAETLHDLIDPLVYAEAVELFDDHHAAGREVVLCQRSGEEVVGPIGEMLGVDQAIATRMVVEDGRYTGEIDFYAYGDNKADRDPRAGRAARHRPRRLLRLQRLRHRRADARGGRPPRRGQPRQAAAQDRGRAGLAGAGLREARQSPQPGAFHTTTISSPVRRDDRSRRGCGGYLVGAQALRPDGRSEVVHLIGSNQRFPLTHKGSRRNVGLTERRQRADSIPPTVVRAVRVRAPTCDQPREAHREGSPLPERTTEPSAMTKMHALVTRP